MALDCLFIDNLNDGKIIAVHPEANYFALKSGKIKQFLINPKPSGKMRKIPNGANIIGFSGYRKNRGNIQYGKIVFYNHQSKILKTYEVY